MVSGTFQANPNVTDDAMFRAWAQAVHSAVAAVLTQTADAGQINLATVLRPSTLNTAAGYEVFRFADSLQATTPLYIKLEYGVGQAVNGARLYLTIGKGTDGAGTITGQLLGRTQIDRGLPANGVADYFASAGDGYFAFAGNVSAAGNGLWIAIDRLRDDNGGPITEGVAFLYISTATDFRFTSIAYDGLASDTSAGSAQPPPMLAPAAAAGTTYKGATAALPIYPWLGWPRHTFMAGIGYAPADAAAGQQFAVDIDGAPRTFRATGGSIGSPRGAYSANGAIRYE